MQSGEKSNADDEHDSRDEEMSVGEGGLSDSHDEVARAVSEAIHCSDSGLKAKSFKRDREIKKTPVPRIRDSGGAETTADYAGGRCVAVRTSFHS